jgi:hypothetical protein
VTRSLRASGSNVAVPGRASEREFKLVEAVFTGRKTRGDERTMEDPEGA